ncbi:hypothetical protein D3C73_573960 [compost metagenome]
MSIAGVAPIPNEPPIAADLSGILPSLPMLFKAPATITIVSPFLTSMPSVPRLIVRTVPSAFQLNVEFKPRFPVPPEALSILTLEAKLALVIALFVGVSKTRVIVSFVVAPGALATSIALTLVSPGCLLPKLLVICVLNDALNVFSKDGSCMLSPVGLNVIVSSFCSVASEPKVIRNFPLACHTALAPVVPIV